MNQQSVKRAPQNDRFAGVINRFMSESVSG
jgi:hypothetical protein